MIRLLDSCIRTLASYGMRNLFIDAVKWGDQGFQELGTLYNFAREKYQGLLLRVRLGFQKWAAYREVWRDA
jgi:hypothetical protein